MKFQDLFFVPFYLILIYAIAYSARSKFTTKNTRKYFIPALSLKLLGGFSIGIIYHYYYGYGDTLRYVYHSRIFPKVFWEDPVLAFRLLTVNLKEPAYDLISYFHGNYFFGVKDEGSFLIVRLTGLLGIITNHSYFAMALIYAAISFTGVWAMYLTFNKIHPALYKRMALACLFFPSLFFWGSGILKDSITIGALGWLFFSIYNLFISRTKMIQSIFIIIISSWLLIVIKVYIFLCFIPGCLIWIFTSSLDKSKSFFLRATLRPIAILVTMPIAITLMGKIAETDKRYALENLEATAKTTAEWIHYSSGESGSAYSLGDDFDLSPTGIIKKLPLAINVTLFRPYLWEVKNPVMLLSALESLFILALTLRIIFNKGLLGFLGYLNTNSFILFLAIFSFSFAFAVGFSTYNFGTLVRYKIPCIPFYLALLFIAESQLPKRKPAKRIK